MKYKELTEYSEEDLKAELKRRERQKEFDERSKLLSDDEICTNSLKHKVWIQDVLNQKAKGNPLDEDLFHYFGEAFLEIYLGDDFWKWWNSH